MRVLITGATGTIGLALADALSARGDQVVALSRDPERGARVLGDGRRGPCLAPIPRARRRRRRPSPAPTRSSTCWASRWRSAGPRTPSGASATRACAARGMLVGGADGACRRRGRPRALVSQSATGYYGPRDDAPLDEQRLRGR